MNDDETKAFLALWASVRGLFHRMSQVAGDLHASAGINGATRGLLEKLMAEGPRGVPELARQGGVSRQHVQVMVNGLLAAGLVEALENPAHRRSPRIAVSAAGREAYKLLRLREGAALSRVAPGASAAEMEAATHILGRVAAGLRAFGK